MCHNYKILCVSALHECYILMQMVFHYNKLNREGCLVFQNIISRDHLLPRPDSPPSFVFIVWFLFRQKSSSWLHLSTFIPFCFPPLLGPSLSPNWPYFVFSSVSSRCPRAAEMASQELGLTAWLGLHEQPRQENNSFEICYECLKNVLLATENSAVLIWTSCAHILLPRSVFFIKC